jgi:mannose-1-phosphate guanylyltransferase
MKVHNVILSGGVGSRLWPLSRKYCPKQYLPIFEGETLFQKTIIRNSRFSDNILVVGNTDNYLLSEENLKNSEVKDYFQIIEACPRNTAAAIAFAAFAIEEDDVMFITPSDHLISDGESYEKAVLRAIELSKQGYLVTFGLKPTKPETGFGYIESDGENVLSFREKPQKELAEYFLKQSNFLWNSGMFCFQAGNYLSELFTHEPEVYLKAKMAFEKSENGKLDFDSSICIPSISVDYAVFEKSTKIKVVNGDFEWSDMGSFESIYEYFKNIGYPVDDLGNMVIGTNIYTEFTGLTNTLLIQTKDAILVLKKEYSQDVKKVYERLEKLKPELV